MSPDIAKCPRGGLTTHTLLQLGDYPGLVIIKLLLPARVGKWFFQIPPIHTALSPHPNASSYAHTNTNISSLRQLSLCAQLAFLSMEYSQHGPFSCRGAGLCEDMVLSSLSWFTLCFPVWLEIPALLELSDQDPELRPNMTLPFVPENSCHGR